MAKTVNTEDVELRQFQEGIRYKLGYISSMISIILIIIGLYLLLNGLFLIAVKDENIETDNVVNILNVEPSIYEGQVNEDGQIDTGTSTGRIEAVTLSGKEKSDINIERIKQSGRWNATNYAKGDIGIGEYSVKLGDTLWEIAEAVYGSGFEWKKILENNKDDIGFLPNGSQALIIPGQVLKIVR